MCKEQYENGRGRGTRELLALAPGVLAAGQRLRVLWTLRAADLPLAVDSFERIPGLASCVHLFVTGRQPAAEAETRALVDRLAAMGAAAVTHARITRDDVLAAASGQPRKFYLCAGPELTKTLWAWLEGEQVATESFAY